MNKPQKIFVFGSAFNPPHRGHQDVVEQCLALADHVIVVPSYHHAFGKNMMPFNLRMELVEAWVSSVSNPDRVSVSTLERELGRDHPDQPVFTYTILEYLQEQYPNAELTFVVGPDNAEPETWRKFYRADDILKCWSLYVAQENKKVRSTLIRNTLRTGKMPDAEMCPAVVVQKLNAFMEAGFDFSKY